MARSGPKRPRKKLLGQVEPESKLANREPDPVRIQQPSVMRQPQAAFASGAEPYRKWQERLPHAISIIASALGIEYTGSDDTHGHIAYCGHPLSVKSTLRVFGCHSARRRSPTIRLTYTLSLDYRTLSTGRDVGTPNGALILAVLAPETSVYFPCRPRDLGHQREDGRRQRKKLDDSHECIELDVSFDFEKIMSDSLAWQFAVVPSVAQISPSDMLADSSLIPASGLRTRVRLVLGLPL